MRYLPDFDEQYAIKSRNIIAKTDFRLDFGEGSELLGVSAEHDTTALALAVLRTIDKVINSEKDIQEAKIDRAVAIQGEKKGAEFADKDRGVEYYFLVETTYIKPGMYRLNKPWECAAATTGGCGLLTKLGLPTVVTVEMKKAE